MEQDLANVLAQSCPARLPRDRGVIAGRGQSTGKPEGLRRLARSLRPLESQEEATSVAAI